MFDAQHAPGDARAEILDLSTDVLKKCVAGPSSEQHDGVNRLFGQLHGHGCARADGVGAHIIRTESQLVLTDGEDRLAKGYPYVGTGDLHQLVADLVGVDGGVV